MKVPVISVKDLSHAFGRHLVLSDVTFDVEPGDFLAILGPNGSGKTTLLRLMLGLLPIQKGEIRLFGTPVGRFKDWHRIGYVPQRSVQLEPGLPISVEEAVALGLLSRKGRPRWMGAGDRERVRRALRTVHMEAKGKARLGDLSGGERQRVLIARAVVKEPQVLLLDEPTAGVDAPMQSEFYGLLGRLNEQGITVVLVTHDIGVVNRHVSKVACLNQRLVFHGTHEEFCSSEEARALIPGDDHLVAHRH